jgi:hypothetical protein
MLMGCSVREEQWQMYKLLAPSKPSTTYICYGMAIGSPRLFVDVVVLLSFPLTKDISQGPSMFT